RAVRKRLAVCLLIFVVIGGIGFVVYRARHGRKSSTAIVSSSTSVSSSHGESSGQPTVAPIVLPPFHWSQALPSQSAPSHSQSTEIKVRDELAQAASDAARALQDLYLRFRQPTSEADFEAQSAPIVKKSEGAARESPKGYASLSAYRRGIGYDS